MRHQSCSILAPKTNISWKISLPPSSLPPPSLPSFLPFHLRREIHTTELPPPPSLRSDFSNSCGKERGGAPSHLHEGIGQWRWPSRSTLKDGFVTRQLVVKAHTHTHTQTHITNGEQSKQKNTHCILFWQGTGAALPMGGGDTRGKFAYCCCLFANAAPVLLLLFEYGANFRSRSSRFSRFIMRWNALSSGIWIPRNDACRSQRCHASAPSANLEGALLIIGFCGFLPVSLFLSLSFSFGCFEIEPEDVRD